MELKRKEVRNIKSAYEKLYLKSRNLKASSNQQDELLAKLVKELFFESIDNSKEDGSISEDKYTKIYQEIMILTQKWKNKLERTSSKKWWHFWK